jgi:aryl-alcohol dehydrogenase-like predicted oxidoreductase
LLSGHWSKARSLAGNDFRAHAPRFSGANLERNLALVEAMQSIGTGRGVTVAQLAIAWVLSRGTDVVPLVGARRRASLLESLAAADGTLSAQEIEAIEAAVPVDAAAGDRYPTAVLAHMDSEK